MQFRAESNVMMPTVSGSAMDMGATGKVGAGNSTLGGNVSGFDEGLQAMHQAYRPMVGRADKHSSNIVGSGGSFKTGISQLRGATS